MLGRLPQPPGVDDGPDSARRRALLRQLVPAGTIVVLVLAAALAHLGASRPPRARGFDGGPATGSVAALSVPRSLRGLVEVQGAATLVGPDALAVPGTLLRPGAAVPLCTSRRVLGSSRLALGPPRRASCADPALYGIGAVPLATGSPSSGVLRVAFAVASGGYRVGPPLLRWRATPPTWVYGGGRLYVVAPGAIGGSAVLTIDASTGALVRRGRGPGFTRPLLAVNEGGLWLAPSAASRLLPGGRAGLVQVASSRAVLVAPFGRARLLVASGRDVWCEVAGAGTTSTLVRAGATSSRHASGFALGDELAPGPASFAGSEAAGLWGVLSGADASVVRIDPDTGVVSTLARLGVAAPRDVPGILVGRAFYLLDVTASGLSGEVARVVAVPAP